MQLSLLADFVESLVAQDRLSEIDPVTLQQINRQADDVDREDCKSLYQFIRASWDFVESRPFVGNWHLECIAEHLEAVTNGEISKLLINIPPGHSKSLCTATFWPMWEWGPCGNPSQRWFFTSYDQKLSIRDSMRCRMLLRSPWFQRLWGDRLKIMPDEDQKTFYRTTAGGWRMASSMGGHLLGEHPGRIVIDDPHNVEQVESDTERKGILDWWDLTIPSRRIGAKASIVIIMQRLHVQDLSGYVLDEGDWVHLCFPLRHEPDHPFISYSKRFDPRTEDGELLSKVYYTEEQAKETERQLSRRLGQYGIAGQLQQRPTPRSGGLFKYDYFRFVPPESLPGTFDAIVRYWDKAGTEAGGKFTSGVLIGKKGERLWVLDVIRAQRSPMAVENLIANTADEDERRYGMVLETWVEQEGGSGGKFQAQFTLERLKGFRVRSESPMKSKHLRAEPLAALFESGLIACTIGPWNEEFRNELCSFPMGKFSDQVDAASGAARKLVRPDIVRVDQSDIDACMVLKGPCYDATHHYRYACAALVTDQFQKYAALVILGANVESGKIGLLHANRWLPEHYVHGRIPQDEIIRVVVQKCKSLRVDGLAIDPGNSEVIGLELAKRGIMIFDCLLNPANRRKLAETLLDQTTSRSVEFYDDRDLLAEIVRLPIKSSVDGYTLEGTSDMGMDLSYGVAYAMALVWATGTLIDHRKSQRS
jgi:predicted phage terminase large subunit-like protein